MLTRRATRRKRSVSFIAAGYSVIRRNGRGRSGPALQARHDCRSLQIRRVQARLIRAEQQDHPRRCIETGADRRRPWKSASSFRQKATTMRGDDLVCGRERICVIHALADPRFIARAEGPGTRLRAGSPRHLSSSPRPALLPTAAPGGGAGLLACSCSLAESHHGRSGRATVSSRTRKEAQHVRIEVRA